MAKANFVFVALKIFFCSDCFFRGGYFVCWCCCCWRKIFFLGRGCERFFFFSARIGILPKFVFLLWGTIFFFRAKLSDSFFSARIEFLSEFVLFFFGGNFFVRLVLDRFSRLLSICTLLRKGHVFLCHSLFLIQMRNLNRSKTCCTCRSVLTALGRSFSTASKVEPLV